ncbi:MAG: hypothetical protein HXY19_08245 [Thermoanaerobaculaceae bacterium]|nr:hypothetical protein [Thermoanaerobaculaceae bacterium]
MAHWLALIGAAMAGVVLAEEPARVLTLERPSAGIAAVAIEAGVGEVEVLASQEPVLSVRIEVSADPSLLRSSRRLREELEQAELVAEERGGTLHLLVRPKQRNRGWGEQWLVRLPATMARTVELGVGDVRILDVAADVTVEVGVGNVRIEGPEEAFGPVSASCGVGDVSLRTPAGRERGSGFIGHELTWRGPGTASIEAEAGVGDVVIRLR